MAFVADGDGGDERSVEGRQSENNPRGIDGLFTGADGAAGAELSDVCGVERAAGGAFALRRGAGDDRPAV